MQANACQQFDEPFQVKRHERKVALNSMLPETQIPAPHETMPFPGFAKFPLNLVSLPQTLLIVRTAQQL